ncbi:hypothetical protein HAX54_001192, partial [Datura stramonium]|nr:hypothetical protein [Datura stramonium]
LELSILRCDLARSSYGRSGAYSALNAWLPDVILFDLVPGCFRDNASPLWITST